MKTDFEYELKRKNPEATQWWIMLNAMAKLYKERAPKEKRYR
jgi:hypothetical protein